MNYQNYEVISRSESACDREARELGVSRYDRAAAMLIAMLFLVGSATFALLLMWMSRETTATENLPSVSHRMPLVLEEPKALLLDEPLPSEIDQQKGLELDETLVAVTEAVSRVAAVGNPDVPFSKTPPRTDREIGPPSFDGLPYRRWQIKFETTSIEEYAKQLDSFGIELGVAGGGYSNMDYAKGFSRSITRRSGKGSAEKRFYMVWQDGVLQRFDRQLLRQANIPVDKRIIMHFYTPQMLDELTRLEREAAKVPIEELNRTVFGVRSNSGSFEFYVISQY
jgi:hypothetical protein